MLHAQMKMEEKFVSYLVWQKNPLALMVYPKRIRLLWISEKVLPWLTDALPWLSFPSLVDSRVCYVAVLGYFALLWWGVCVGEAFFFPWSVLSRAAVPLQISNRFLSCSPLFLSLWKNKPVKWLFSDKWRESLLSTHFLAFPGVLIMCLPEDNCLRK